MGLSRNHFQLNSGRSPVRSQLRPFSSRRFNSPVYDLDWPVPVDTDNRSRCGRSLVHCARNPSPGPRPPTRSSERSRLIYSTDPWRRTLGANRGATRTLKRRFVLVGTLRESLQDNEITDVRLGVKWSQVQMGASKFAYTSPIGVQPCRRNSRTDGVPTPGLASCPAIADPTRDIHRREANASNSWRAGAALK
jgi:hypothetical protein